MPKSQRVYTSTTIGVRQFRAELRAWLAHVQEGNELTVTDRGEPVAHLTPPVTQPRSRRQASTLWNELVAAGHVHPATHPKADLSWLTTVKARGSVSDLIKDQRR